MIIIGLLEMVLGAAFLWLFHLLNAPAVPFILAGGAVGQDLAICIMGIVEKVMGW